VINKHFDVERLNNVAEQRSVSIDLKEEIETEATYLQQVEYRLTMCVGTLFRANDAQYDKAKSIAIAQMKHHLYDDLYADLYAAMNVANTEAREIIGKVIARIREEVKPT